MLQNSFIADWLKGLPEILQYILIIAFVLVLLYVCLTVTRLLGQKHGEKVTYDDPEAYEKQLPNLFRSTSWKRDKKGEEGKKEEGRE